MRKIIVFDIDDTLTDFTKLYLEYALKYDKSLRNNGVLYQKNQVSDAFDWTEQESLEFRKNFRSLVHKNARIKDGALDLLNKLHNLGFPSNF